MCSKSRGVIFTRPVSLLQRALECCRLYYCCQSLPGCWVSHSFHSKQNLVDGDGSVTTSHSADTEHLILFRFAQATLPQPCELQLFRVREIVPDACPRCVCRYACGMQVGTGRNKTDVLAWTTGHGAFMNTAPTHRYAEASSRRPNHLAGLMLIPV